MKKSSYDELIAVRVYKTDKADLSRVASSWQLDEAEIVRRALRAGLKVLARVELPGCRETREGRHDDR